MKILCSNPQKALPCVNTCPLVYRVSKSVQRLVSISAHHRSRHVILYQSPKFYPNRTTLGRKNDVMSIFKMVDLSHLRFYGYNDEFFEFSSGYAGTFQAKVNASDDKKFDQCHQCALCRHYFSPFWQFSSSLNAERNRSTDKTKYMYVQDC